MMRRRALLGALAITAVSCGSPLSQQGSRPSIALPQPAITRPGPQLATTLPPSIAGVDRNDPTAVAQAALQVWFTWFPVYDAGPIDAVARTAPLLTAEFATAAAGQRPARDPGVAWEQWAQQRIEIAAIITLGVEPTPPDTEDRRHRSFVVTQSGNTTPPTIVSTGYVDVVLSRELDGWRVATVRPR